MQLIPNPLLIPVGIVIGILVAAPVGPVNVLCIQRAVERGFWGGVAAGLGAVLGDGLTHYLPASVSVPFRAWSTTTEPQCSFSAGSRSWPLV